MEIPKAYEPQAVESKWYQFWLDQKCFVADAASSKPAYSIVIPPPNVTGVLHMAHVQNAGHVGRRNDDGISRLGRSGVGHKTFLVEPELVPFRLDGLRFVSFGNFHERISDENYANWRELAGKIFESIGSRIGLAAAQRSRKKVTCIYINSPMALSNSRRFAQFASHFFISANSTLSTRA